MPAISPPMQKPIQKCVECNIEIFEGDTIFYDKEGGVDYCSKKCFRNHMIDNIEEFFELVEEHFLEETTAEKE